MFLGTTKCWGGTKKVGKIVPNVPRGYGLVFTASTSTLFSRQATTETSPRREVQAVPVKTALLIFNYSELNKQ